MESSQGHFSRPGLDPAEVGRELAVSVLDNGSATERDSGARATSRVRRVHRPRKHKRTLTEIAKDMILFHPEKTYREIAEILGAGVSTVELAGRTLRTEVRAGPTYLEVAAAKRAWILAHPQASVQETAAALGLRRDAVSAIRRDLVRQGLRENRPYNWRSKRLPVSLEDQLLRNPNLSLNAIAEKYNSHVRSLRTTRAKLRREGKLPPGDKAPGEVKERILVLLNKKPRLTYVAIAERCGASVKWVEAVARAHRQKNPPSPDPVTASIYEAVRANPDVGPTELARKTGLPIRRLITVRQVLINKGELKRLFRVALTDHSVPLTDEQNLLLEGSKAWRERFVRLMTVRYGADESDVTDAIVKATRRYNPALSSYKHYTERYVRAILHGKKKRAPQTVEYLDDPNDRFTDD